MLSLNQLSPAPSSSPSWPPIPSKNRPPVHHPPIRHERLSIRLRVFRSPVLQEARSPSQIISSRSRYSEGSNFFCYRYSESGKLFSEGLGLTDPALQLSSSKRVAAKCFSTRKSYTGLPEPACYEPAHLTVSGSHNFDNSVHSPRPLEGSVLLRVASGWCDQEAEHGRKDF